MSHRFAVFPAGAVNTVEEANNLVYAMCAGGVGEPAPAVQALIDTLPDSGQMLCVIETPPDSRGVMLTTEQPENGLLRYLLLETMDRGLAVYDLELFRLYDPRERVDIEVRMNGDVSLPYLTRALLWDFALRPTWPSPDAPFFIVLRNEDEFVQTYRNADGTYQLEYQEGGIQAHFACRTTDVGLVADVMWSWVTQDPRWRSAVAWTRMEFEETDHEDTYRPNNTTIFVDEFSDRRMTFDQTGGAPFLAYHAGSPDNEKDADGRLIPLGWVLHISDEEQVAMSVPDFDNVVEALFKANDCLGNSTHDASRRVSLRSEHRDDGSWLTLDAKLDDDGSLRISGQDFGPVTGTISSDGEYEYFYTFAAKDVPALVAALGGQPGTDVMDLLAQRYCGDASYELERKIKSSGVEYRFSNWF